MSFQIEHLNPVGLRVNPAFTNVIVVTGSAKRIIIGAVDPVDEHGALVGRGDLAAQTEQIFNNLETMLGAAGATLQDVIIWRIFVVQGQQLESAGGDSVPIRPPIPSSSFRRWPTRARWSASKRRRSSPRRLDAAQTLAAALTEKKCACQPSHQSQHWKHDQARLQHTRHAAEQQSRPPTCPHDQVVTRPN